MKNNFCEFKDFSTSLMYTALYFILMNNKVRGDGTPPPRNSCGFKFWNYKLKIFFPIISFENQARFFVAFFPYCISKI
jgi:hypothetical protein